MNGALHVGHGSTVGAVTLFPVWTDAPGINGLDWTGAGLRVAEREGSPVVGELVIENTGAKPVVLLEGDLLAGGWQDRMLAAGTILAPRESRVVEVVCVEVGRWGGVAAHGAERRRGAASVRYGLASAQHADVRNDPAQNQVWDRIERFEADLGGTESSSMLDHLDRAPRVELRRLPGQRGVVVGIGGVVAWGELFGSTAGLASRWEGIVNAAMLDAQLAPMTGTTTPTTASAARRFVSAWAAMTLEDGGDTDGLVALRSRRGALTLSGIRHGDRVVHATVFHTAHPQMDNAGGN